MQPLLLTMKSLMSSSFSSRCESIFVAILLSLTSTALTNAAESSPKTSTRKDPATHWAFQVPVRPTVPKARDARGIRNPIDAFIREKLEQRFLIVGLGDAVPNLFRFKDTLSEGA